MIKTITSSLLILSLTACTDNQTVRTEQTIPRTTPTTSSTEQATTKAENKLIKDTIRLLDDKDFWRKSNNIQKLDQTQLKFTLIAPIDEMHSKWHNNQHPAAQPCQSALKQFNQTTLNLAENKADQETDNQYQLSYKKCRSYLK